MNDAPGTRDREAPGARRFVSPALFAVVVICFFLPFVTIACGEAGQGAAQEIAGEFGATPPAGEGLPEDGKLADFTGWQLVTGDQDELEAAEGVPEAAPEGFPSQPTGDIRDSQPFAIAALAIAVLGIALSWLALWVGPIAGAALGIGGLVALFLLKGSVEDLIPGAGGFQLVEFRWEIGFWIAMASFGLAAAWSIYRLLTEARVATRRTDVEPAPPPPPDADRDVAPPPPPPPPPD